MAGEHSGGRRQRTRTPAAQRKADTRRAELERECEATQQRIAGLQGDLQQLEEQRIQTSRAIDQMIGRLRLLQEWLGEQPPMVAPPASEGEPD